MRLIIMVHTLFRNYEYHGMNKCLNYYITAVNRVSFPFFADKFRRINVVKLI